MVRRRSNYRSAKRNWGGSRTRTRRKRNDKRKSLTTLAYQYGQLDRGLQNPDSAISAAYNRGLEKREFKPKRPLF